MTLCPCCSKIDLSNCCGPYLQDKAIPLTPEALMRSRYTAYSMANIDYIKKTMLGKALDGFDEAEATLWARSVRWLGLKIIQTQQDTDPTIGFVEFIASYQEQSTPKTIHENSQFLRVNGRWFYTEGIHLASLHPLQKNHK